MKEGAIDFLIAKFDNERGGRSHDGSGGRTHSGSHGGSHSGQRRQRRREGSTTSGSTVSAASTSVLHNLALGGAGERANTPGAGASSN